MKILMIIILLILLICVFCWWQNNSIVVSNYAIENIKIPQEFHNYKIVQISDLHNKNFNGKLVDKIKNIQPDAIFITGDLIDARKPNVEIVINLLKQLVDIAPVYYTPGNHEARLDGFEEIVPQLKQTGIIVLQDEVQTIYKDNSSISLVGLNDPAFTNIESMTETLQNLSQHTSNFTMLLAHRPEYFELYASYNIDLAFSGHAHGGQARIPFTSQGLFAPGQGFFPKYTSGVHTNNSTSIVISRGVGPSSFPLRLFNRPELIVVTLKSSS